MKIRLGLVCVFIAHSCVATTVYVSLTGSHTPPFDSLITAATNIQSAVNVAIDGDNILIDDGVYMLSSVITITTPITLQSKNSRESTIVNGSGLVPCFELDNVSCVLSGLTITNGYNSSEGGGVTCAGNSPLITNCVVVGNNAAYGGGVFQGTISHSVVLGNMALENGGGILSGIIYHSVLYENIALGDGGGIHDSEVRNSLLYSNIASNGFGGGVYLSDVYNCTVVANTAGGDAGGVDGSSVYNSIVYNNSASVANDLDLNFNTVVEYTCSSGITTGIDGNITNSPSFVDFPAGNFRLKSGSPCINIGDNTSVASAMDLDGYTRMIAGTVDMGAYEVQTTPTDLDGDGMLDAWEIQYFVAGTNTMPNDNGDTDQFTNLEEYIAGTDPTNSGSFFAVTHWSTGSFVVQWPSVAYRKYAVLWAESLTNGFVQQGLMIDYPQNSYTDTIHTAESSGFYTVEVQLK